MVFCCCMAAPGRPQSPEGTPVPPLEPTPEAVRRHLEKILAAHGRFNEALGELSRAAALNPLAYLVSNDEAAILYCARRYGQAGARARKTLDVDPSFIFAHIIIGACQSASGRYTEAIREYRVVLAQSRGPVLGRLGNALALSGQRAEAESFLHELEADAATSGNGRVHRSFRAGWPGRQAGCARQPRTGLASPRNGLELYCGGTGIRSIALRASLPGTEAKAGVVKGGRFRGLGSRVEIVLPYMAPAKRIEKSRADDNARHASR